MGAEPEKPKLALVTFEPGTVVFFEKKIWRVAGRAEGGLVQILRPGAATIRSVEGKQLLHLGSEIRSTFEQKHHEEIPADAIKKARIRLELVQEFLGTRMDDSDLKEISGRAGCHTSTFLRWVDRYVFSGGKFSTLIPFSGRYGNTNRRIKGTVLRILQEAIERYYLGPRRLKRGRVYIKYKKMCELENIRPATRGTVYRYLGNLPGAEVVTARVSKRAAYQMFGPHEQRATTGECPLHVIQIDHTLLDVFIMLGELLVKRPWITVAIDTFSRMIVGFYLSFDAPCAQSVGFCLYRVMTSKEDWLQTFGIQTPWPVAGRPYILHADNGKDFRSEHVIDICLEHDIVAMFRPVKEPQYGAYIERLMGTLALEMETLPGATFRDIILRKEREDKPEALATLSLDQLEQILLSFFVEQYHQGPHSGLLNASPISRWRDGWAAMDLSDPLRQHVLVEPSPDLLLGLLPSFKRTIQNDGVSWKKRRFFDLSIVPYIRGGVYEGRAKKYRFHYDKRNFRFIYFKDPVTGEILRIPARDTGLSDISEWEYEASQEDNARKAELTVDREIMAAGMDSIEAIILESSNNANTKKFKKKTKVANKKELETLRNSGKTSASLKSEDIQRQLNIARGLTESDPQTIWNDVPIFESEDL